MSFSDDLPVLSYDGLAQRLGFIYEKAGPRRMELVVLTSMINANGQIVVLRDEKLSQHLKVDLSEEFLCKYCVQTRGHIAICEGKSTIEVRLRPSVVSDVAMISLFAYLGDMNFKWVRWVQHGREHEDIVLPIAEAKLHLLRLIDESPRLSAVAKYQLLVRSIPEHDSSLTRAARQFQSSTDGKRNFRDIKLMCEEMFGGRYTITGHLPSTRDLVIYASGTAYASLDLNWCSIAEGLRLEDGPDYEYGCWVAQAHRATLEAQAPAYAEVDALIYRPRKGKLRTRYSRLLLPFQLRSERRLILSVSQLNDAIDLRETA